VARPGGQAGSVPESLLVLSDVHLGSDLNDHAPEGKRTRRSREVDDDLVKLLTHYRHTRPAGERWRLVIAGDFIDFIGMAILPKDEEVATLPSDEERAHGLGNAADHVRVKLRRVAERHADVFAALAAFVADGHALTLVHGNHDLEFHWEMAQVEFRSILLAHAIASRGLHTLNVAAFATQFFERIEFNPWFFYVHGMAYIEHGHQYDALCATDHVMLPVSPADPRRIARGFCDVLLRYVVRPTLGMKEHGHERTGLLDYIGFAMRLGVGGLVKLTHRFAGAVMELFRVRKASISEAAQRLREEHERRLALLAEATRIGIDRLRALAALQVPPVTRSISGILASVLLDRLALGLGAFLLLVVFAVLGAYRGSFWCAAACVAFTWAVGHKYLSSRRKVDPDDALIERAGRLARLFPAAFVVMGHTHVPVRVPVAEGAATYINVGSWAEDEEDAQGPAGKRAARTHLVIHPDEAGPIAEFLAWGTDGPRRFVAESVKDVTFETPFDREYRKA
jgi:UDP-2,3-diacylglucosamine pyrophosphatase LpxH